MPCKKKIEMIAHWSLLVTVCWSLWTHEIGTKAENITVLDNCTVSLVQNISISRDTNCAKIQIYNDTCVPHKIWMIEINNETCHLDDENSFILRESYCEYPIPCNNYPSLNLSYQCYNNQSRINSCSIDKDNFSNGRLILNVTALLEQYQEEFIIRASTVNLRLNQTFCTFEIFIKIIEIAPTSTDPTRMASSIGSSTSAQMTTSSTATTRSSGASSLTATVGVRYAITTLLLFLVSLFCSY